MSTTRDEGRLRLLVIASTFPGREGDGTPPFVSDLADYEARHLTTLALVPRVPGAPRHEQRGELRIERFPYFLQRWERLAHGAILENVRADPLMLAQVPALLAGELIALRRAVRQFRPDVVHVHWIVPQGLVALLAARDIPWVVTTLGGDLYALRGPIWRDLKGRVLRRAYAVTTMNRDMRDSLLALGASADRTLVLPMGADLEQVRRHGRGVARVSGRVLFAGRLVEKKGLAVLLEAMHQVPADIEWSLDVVGDGPLRGGLEAAARALPHPVRFLGQQTRQELARSMFRADIVVLPSVTAASGDQDGLPVVLLEAMGAGCAIVASRLAGIDEAVEDGVSGMLTPQGDPAALARAVGVLLREPIRRQTLGQVAARRAEQFSIEAIGQRYVSLLQEAAASRRARPT